jgi:hypothetical protein
MGFFVFSSIFVVYSSAFVYFFPLSTTIKKVIITGLCFFGVLTNLANFGAFSSTIEAIEAEQRQAEREQRAAEREAERAKEQAGKYIISSSSAYSMLRGCCVGAGGAWAQDQKCVGNWDQGEAFYACAKSKDKDTYIRHKSGNLEKLNPRDFMR